MRWTTYNPGNLCARCADTCLVDVERISIAGGANNIDGRDLNGHVLDDGWCCQRVVDCAVQDWARDRSIQDWLDETYTTSNIDGLVSITDVQVGSE